MEVVICCEAIECSERSPFRLLLRLLQLLLSSATLLPLLVQPPWLTYSDCLQVQEESTMEALKASLKRESLHAGQSQGVWSEEACCVVEKGNLLGEGFSVDDLLDFGEFVEDEAEAEDDDEVGEEQQETEGEERCKETEKSSSHSSSPSSSSALTFELPPPPLSDMCLPAHDAEELEWVSFIIDDSPSQFPPPCSGGASLPPPPSDGPKEYRQPRASPPPCGEAPSSCLTVCTLSTEAMVPIKAKRSKRSRNATAAWSMYGPFSFADSSSSSTATTSSASCCSSTSSASPFLIYGHSAGAVEQSFLLYDHPPPPKKQKPKKRGRKPKFPPSATFSASGDRRCSHCGVQKTPQWRAGPLGAKTLCNACGVRFKSGRLLPEYRPACSPTFVSHIHSNSHRKVLEMRRKKETDHVAIAAPPVVSF